MSRLVFGGVSALGALVLGAGLFLFSPAKTVVIAGPDGLPGPGKADLGTGNHEDAPISPAPSAEIPPPDPSRDIEPQKPLPNPPDILRGIYITAWVAGSEKRMAALTAFMKLRGLNAAVVDVKDYSGFVSYRTGIPAVAASGAEGDIRIARPNALVKSLHDAGIYAIARVTAFQDPVLAKAKPELAVRRISTGSTWKDRKGLAWLDPAGKESWEYIAAIARDAAARGFDEINFDYIRFPSDGDLADMKYPFWDGTTPRHRVIASFFSRLRRELSGVNISADLFGLTTVAGDDLGIGQVIEDAYREFDGVYPMVYPSHFAAGSAGYKNPAAHPYEIIRYAMDGALMRLFPPPRPAGSSTTPASAPVGFSAKLRPWIQAFDFGAVYDRAKIDAQIRATEDAFASSSAPAAFAGWFLWDPSNRYAGYQE